MRSTPSTTRNLPPINGQLAAEYATQATAEPSGTRYLTADHLGSTRITTNATGAVLTRRDYLPFGDEIAASVSGRTTISGYAASTTIRQKFTGKERDGESGLDFFGARYFSAPQGRFTSADEPFADQYRENPQSWNLYAYTRNNPLAFVDEGGMQARKVTEPAISPLPDVAANQRMGAVLVGAAKGLGQSFVDLGRTMGMPGANASNLESHLQYSNAREKAAGDIVNLGQVLSGTKSLAAAGIFFLKDPLKAVQAFRSFSALKTALGPAGEGMAWHHIVEQSKAGEFGAEAIHNLANVIKVPKEVNDKLNAYYSSKRAFTGNKTVREWLKGKSWQEQFQFGLDRMYEAMRGELQ